MIFQLHPPSKALQPFVQCYLEADGRLSLQRGEHILFPNGLSGVFFNFGNTEKIILKEEYDTPKVSVFGQIDQHFTITHLPGFYSLGVMLKPSVLSWMLRVNMSEFTNRAFDGQLIKSDLHSLHNQLQEIADTKRKIEAVELYLSSVLLKNSRPVTLTDHALHLIHQQQSISIHQLSKQLRVSQRHLELHFKKTVGLSPKTYSLIQRFSRIEKELMQSSTIQWRDLLFANEYYDQNHFIKDFKRFTGLTPSAYLMENLEMGRSYLNAR